MEGAYTALDMKLGAFLDVMKIRGEVYTYLFWERGGLHHHGVFTGQNKNRQNGG